MSDEALGASVQTHLSPSCVCTLDEQPCSTASSKGAGPSRWEVAEVLFAPQPHFLVKLANFGLLWKLKEASDLYTPDLRNTSLTTQGCAGRRVGRAAGRSQAATRVVLPLQLVLQSPCEEFC